MNVVHMKYAVEIAKTQSISKAAENLYMAQPNLSRAIKELEDALGITIFNRTSKGITVTPDGEEFLQYAKRIISQVNELEDMYKNNKKQKQSFSICCPRASYISRAFTEFSKTISTDFPAEIFYRETNSMHTINGVVRGDFDLGIIRYQSSFDKYFKSVLLEKKLYSELVADFSYVLVMSENHPLAAKDYVYPDDLVNYIEICHADPYVPSLPLIDVKKAELSENVDKRIYVYERGSQFELLQRVPSTFMWVSPIPEDSLKEMHLVEKKCVENKKIYKDVFIHRNDYKLSELDNKFINCLCESKRQCIK